MSEKVKSDSSTPLKMKVEKPTPEYIEKRWRQVRELYNKVCKNNLRKIEQIERIILQ